LTVTTRITRDTFEVREDCSIELTLTSTDALHPGDTVEVQFPNTWTILSGPSFTRELQSTNPDGDHYLSVSSGDAAFEIDVRPRHLYDPDKPGRHGRHIVATVTEGSVPAGAAVTLRYANTFAPYVSETESVWVSMRGERPAELPTLTVTPGPMETMRIIAPSGVKPGVSFEVLVISLDRFENASSTTLEKKTLTRDDGTVVAEGLTFTGGIRVPVTLDAEGVYRFRLDDVVSNAVKCAADTRGPYWGDTHIHTKVSSDAQGTEPYAYARDVSGLDFAAPADHCERMGERGYRQIADWADAAYVPGEFVSIPADERNPGPWTGHHNIYFRSVEAFLENAVQTPEGEPIPRDPANVMLIPHHTGISWGGGPSVGKGSSVDWDAVHDGGLRPVMEIYSHHGQSETYCPQHILAYEFNRMRNPERRTNRSTPGPFYAQDVLMTGRRIGFIGSSDEHSGQGGRRHGGLAAVFTDELTRDGIFDAIRARQCYATTGERILLEFSVASVTMGRETRRKKGTKLPIALRVWGTDLLLRVEILRFRAGVDASFVVIYSDAPRPESMDASVDIEDDFTADAIYYARVTQQPLEWPAMAWSSPVWVDTR